MKSLYLHWGPGANAAAERELVIDPSHSIDFWDQPECSSYGELLQKTAARLEELRATAIVAHSFGARIALDLLNQNPDLPIKKLVFLAPTFDPRQSFWNLAQSVGSETLGTLPPQPPKSAAETFELVGKLMQVPGLMDRYWGTSAQSQKQKLASDQFWAKSSVPPFSPDPFGILLSTWIEASEQKTQTAPTHPWNFAVRVHLGAQDPLQGNGQEFERFCRAQLSAHTENLEIKMYPGVGHFVPLEVEAQQWRA
jgi:pimeloyl-ACP methyl ester carboxylesterase